jgi:Na+-driven multidrug efflux pump
MMKLFRVLILVSLIHGSLSSIFVLGLGPIPSLGIRGAALGQIISACIGSLLFLKHLFKPSAPVPIQRPHLRFEWSLIKGILKVGGVSSLSPIQTAGTAIFLTGLVGLFGIPALTGYNIAVRIEFLQLLLLYGFGTALVSTISTNLGAGNPTRARQFGKLGLLVFCIFTGGIGFFSAFFPQYWVAIFTSDPEVLEAGAKYLNMVGPVFVFGGFSTALYFIAQGTGRMLLPVLGGTIRILIIVIGSLVYIRAYQDGVHGVFAVIGVAYFCASVMAFLTTMSFWGWAAKKAAIA